MVICEICGRELVSLKALTSHIQVHNIISYDYYITYLKKETDGICLNYKKFDGCEKNTKWINLIVGYHKYCCPKCYCNSEEFKKLALERCGNKHWLKQPGVSHPNKGKTYEEIMGVDKSKEIKKKLSIIGKTLIGDKNPFFKKEHSKENKEIFRNNKLGKTYEEMYGEEKANKLRSDKRLKIKV